MLESIAELEKGLIAQQESLASDIRTTETALLSIKEGYLKVQGALEILAILKTKVTKESNEDVAAAIALE
jgi:hypothetical protein